MDHIVAPPSLTIGDLAERTGVPRRRCAAGSRATGFREPVRFAGGHRRYAERRRRRRARGAARTATAASRWKRPYAAPGPRRCSRGPSTPSCAAGSPSWPPQLLSKTHACWRSATRSRTSAARGRSEPVLFGGFQRDSFLRSSYARWVELARTARSPSSSPTSPLRATHAPGCRSRWPSRARRPSTGSGSSSATPPTCRRAWPRSSDPARRGVADSRRRFEAVWTVDPQAVRHASRVAATLADEYRPGWRRGELAVLGDEPAAASADLRRASDVLSRTMDYLDTSH